MPLRPWQTPGAVLSNPLTHKCCSDTPTQHPKLVLPSTELTLRSALPSYPSHAAIPLELSSSSTPSLPSCSCQAAQGEKSLRKNDKSLPEKFYLKSLIKTLILLLQTQNQTPLFSFRGAKDGPCTSLKKQPHN